MKLKVRITATIKVGDLAHYGVATLQEAAALTQRQCDEGEVDILELVASNELDSVEIEAVEE
jgi:alanine racemase